MGCYHHKRVNIYSYVFVSQEFRELKFSLDELTQDRFQEDNRIARPAGSSRHKPLHGTKFGFRNSESSFVTLKDKRQTKR